MGIMDYFKPVDTWSFEGAAQDQAHHHLLSSRRAQPGRCRSPVAGGFQASLQHGGWDPSRNGLRDSRFKQAEAI